MPVGGKNMKAKCELGQRRGTEIKIQKKINFNETVNLIICRNSASSVVDSKNRR